MAQHRYLIPASNYIEWEKGGRKKTQDAIRPAQNDRLYMAGIYRIVADKLEFSTLTRELTQSIVFLIIECP